MEEDVGGTILTFYFLSFSRLILMCVCVYVCVCSAHGVQRRASDPYKDCADLELTELLPLLPECWG